MEQYLISIRLLDIKNYFDLQEKIYEIINFEEYTKLFYLYF